MLISILYCIYELQFNESYHIIFRYSTLGRLGAILIAMKEQLQHSLHRDTLVRSMKYLKTNNSGSVRKLTVSLVTNHSYSYVLSVWRLGCYILAAGGAALGSGIKT